MTEVIERAISKLYILDHDLADKAIAWLQMQRALAPNKPGSCITRPARATSCAERADRKNTRGGSIKDGQGPGGDVRPADEAWYRARQTQLTKFPDEIPAQDSLSAD